MCTGSFEDLQSSWFLSQIKLATLVGALCVSLDSSFSLWGFGGVNQLFFKRSIILKPFIGAVLLCWSYYMNIMFRVYDSALQLTQLTLTMVAPPWPSIPPRMDNRLKCTWTVTCFADRCCCSATFDSTVTTSVPAPVSPSPPIPRRRPPPWLINLLWKTLMFSEYWPNEIHHFIYVQYWHWYLGFEHLPILNTKWGLKTFLTMVSWCLVDFKFGVDERNWFAESEKEMVPLSNMMLHLGGFPFIKWGLKILRSLDFFAQP